MVEAALAGNAERLKAYTIATDALGRDETFDPQNDPIVRVEAGRLRQALARYYAGEGRDDDVVIGIPRGHYVPVIRRRAGLKFSARTVRSFRRFVENMRRSRMLHRLGRYRIRFAAGIVATAVAICIVIDFYWTAGPDGRPDATASVAIPAAPADSSAARFAIGVPIVAVEMFEQYGASRQKGRPFETLDDKVRLALARFDEIKVLDDLRPSPARQPANELPGDDNRAAADFRIAGLIDYRDDGSVQVAIRLTDPADRMIVWARTFESAAGADLAVDEKQIVRDTAASLAELNGVIHAYGRKLRAASVPVDPRYGCLLDAIEEWRSYNKNNHDAVRACLEATIARDPNYFLAHAFLSIVYLREDHLLAPPGAESGNNRALRSAQRAVVLMPGSARAHQMLMRVHALHRDIAAARAAGNKAMVLNPYSPTISGEFGYRLITFGEVERGLSLLRQTMGDSGVRPVMLDFGLCLGEYLAGNLAAAAGSCNKITSRYTYFSLSLQALVAARTGDKERADRLFGRLIRNYPGWRSNPRAQLEKVIMSPAIVDRLLRELAESGLRPS